jgi:uncharacterized protein (DUF488 family)
VLEDDANAPGRVLPRAGRDRHNAGVSDLVLTIGHSTHPAARLIELLRAHEVTAVADVRSQPYSRWNPQFNRKSLDASLEEAGLAYLFLGRELGARTEDRSCWVDGKVQYDRLAATTLFREGISRIEEGVGRHRIALLCAEKDPLTCHRAILVCRHLVGRGLRAAHILATGELERHEDAVGRLLAEVGAGDADLFRSREDLVAEAYRLRGAQIAWVGKPA